MSHQEQLLEKLRQQLKESVDPKYKEFHQSLVPGCNTIMGVRIPRLREIAKAFAKENWQSIWGQLSKACYEELMIQGMLIGYAKLTDQEAREYLRQFVPRIDNWAVCDCCCSTWKFIKKNRAGWFKFIKNYVDSKQEYEVRFAVVCLMQYYIDEEHLQELFTIFDSITHKGYYVQMAVAWAVSVCFAKFPTETWEYMSKDQLDDFTHNKTIQKCRESYRVTKEDNERLLTIKRG